MEEHDPGKHARADQAMDAHLADQDAAAARGQRDTTATQTMAPAGWYPDPSMVGTLRYWDGAAWTDHRAPALGQTTGQPLATPAPGTDARDEPRFAWLLALLPILWLPFDYFVPEFSFATPAIIATTVANGMLATADAERLKRRGVRMSPLWGWLFPPVYVILRTRRARSTVWMPVVYFLGIAVSIVGAVTFAYTYELTDADIGIIERDLEQRSDLDNVTVTCPEEVVRAGDRIWCTARSGGETVDLTVDFSNDGWDFVYTWQVRN